MHSDDDNRKADLFHWIVISMVMTAAGLVLGKLFLLHIWTYIPHAANP